MGDNRGLSDDSRGHRDSGSPYEGTVPENEVTGRAFLIIWPPSQLGDLPIPSTFQQAALHAGTAALQPGQAAAVAFFPAAGLLGIWMLVSRRRR
jgi:signal peptidase I